METLWPLAHRELPWWSFQLLAIAVGALVILRAARRALPAYGAGVVLAAIGGGLFGCGGAWLRFAISGGAPPDLEVAGFGALAGLFLGFVLVARRRMQLAPALDALALAVGPMLTVARLGCFVAGCDFGAPTNVAWALRYPHWTPAFREQLARGLIAEAAPSTLPVHPTQLYEAMLGLALFAVALRCRRRRWAAVVALYAAGRFGIDFLRGDLARGLLWLTASQWLAVATVGLVIGLTFDASTRPRSDRCVGDSKEAHTR
jgi:phosphatidylglycerol---prolipoprotein diacylglyceryl transferase